MEALVEHCEDHRFGEADEQQAEPRREHDLTERQRRADMTRTCQQLLEEVMLLPLEAWLFNPQRQERGDDGNEARRVEDRDRAAADRRVDRGADERCNQPQALSHGLEEPVRFTDQIARQDDGDERGARRGGEGPGRAVERGDRVDDPDVAAVVHEEE